MLVPSFLIWMKSIYKKQKSKTPKEKGKAKKEIKRKFRQKGDSSSSKSTLSLFFGNRSNIGKRFSGNQELDQVSNLDRQLDSMNLKHLLEARTYLEGFCTKNPNAPDVLYRLGKCYHHLSELGPSSEKLKFINKGIKVCSRAAEFEDNCAEVHKWLCIMLGMTFIYEELTIEQKLSRCVKIQSHLEKALRLNPKDECLHFIKGWFLYTIASLNWFERGLVHAAHLKGSFSDALACFKQAEELSNKQWKENKLYIAKCYIELNDLKQAVHWLRLASDAHGMNKDLGRLPDTSSEIMQLLRKYDN